jgi:ubiquinone/menaquinone biosynthesis C-methylase UbiE
MLELAEQRAATQGVADRTTFVPGPMDRLPFADGEFSLVVSRYALHHAVEPAAAAAEMARVTAPEGRIVVVDFAAGDDPEAASGDGHAHEPDHESHVHDLTAEQVPALFAPHGFRVAATDTYRLEADADAGSRFRNPIVSFRLVRSA